MTRNLLGSTALCLLLTLIEVAGADAAPADSARVDSLFIYASSGQVRYRDMVQPAKDSLIAMGESAAPWLARKLNATDARERLTLADLFAGIGAVAVPYITPYLTSDNDYEPKNAVRCLGRIADTSATLALIAQLDHEDYAVRSGVATALGKIGDERAVKPLLDRLTVEPDPDVRKSTVVALGSIGDPAASDALVTAFGDSFFGVRQTAIMAVGKLSAPPTGKIAGAIHTTTGVARHAAIVALGYCNDDMAYDLLFNMLSSPDPMIRGFAVEGMSLDTVRVDIPAIEDRLIGESDPFVRAQLIRLKSSH